MKVLIMGLGLHGGGLESARYLLRHGAEITVTDLSDEKKLAPTIEKLEASFRGSASAGGYPPIRYVLGRHEIEDFTNADIVIKNPGVRPDSPYLQAAGRIETDISLFLAAVNSADADNAIRLTAVTGSKGKSSVASALYHVLAQTGRAYLGGNITVSPLTFVDELQPGDDVVLELSSWQLGDLGGRRIAGRPLLKPNAAILTAIMPDHLDRYGSMEEYVADKRVIYRGQDSDDITVAENDNWGKSFLAESNARALAYSAAPLPKGVSGGWFEDPAGPGFARLGDVFSHSGGIAEIVPAKPLVPGFHQKKNLLAAGLALFGMGLPPQTIREGLGSFPGVEHRLELFHRAGGIGFYNDSAATIPEAAAAAIEALSSRPGRDGGLVLVAGGADKNLDFTPLVQAATRTKAIVLLAGSASEKMRSLLGAAGINCLGPFDSLDAAVSAAMNAAAPGDCIALSPGCASFGMFLNEFDRGRKWKETVKKRIFINE